MIIKKVALRASREHVWKAITEAEQFGTWFGVTFDGSFAEGETITGKMTPTQVDAEIAKSQEPYTGAHFEIVVEKIEPMHHFSFRWHPYAVEPGTDYSHEDRTLVTFELEDTEEGTLLTITESGFDGVSLERRAKAFEMNEQGWEAQTRLIAKYLTDA